MGIASSIIRSRRENALDFFNSMEKKDPAEEAETYRDPFSIDRPADGAFIYWCVSYLGYTVKNFYGENAEQEAKIFHESLKTMSKEEIVKLLKISYPDSPAYPASECKWEEKTYEFKDFGCGKHYSKILK